MKEDNFKVGDVVYTTKGCRIKGCTDDLTIIEINQIRSTIEKHVHRYLPSFHSFFTFDSYFTALKTKQSSTRCDDRNTFIVPTADRIFSVHSGKIDTIFDIEHQVATIISNI